MWERNLKYRSKLMKITFILDSFGGGGKERRCLQLIQGLNNAGYTDIQVIIINNNIAYPELFETTAQICVLDKKNQKTGMLQICKNIFRCIKRYNPDIVQVWSIAASFYVDCIKYFCKFVYLVAYVADADRPKHIKIFFANIISRCLCKKVIGNSWAGIKAYG